MKKYLYLLLIAFAFTACKKNNLTEIEPVDLNIKINYSLSTSTYTLPLNIAKLKITNIETRTVQEFTANDKGVILISKLAPGFYDIDASANFSANEYSTITGTVTEKAVTFNASLKNKQITVGFSESINLNLIAGSVGDWVIKQIYFAGSDRVNGALYRDQFIEFYNNSDKHFMLIVYTLQKRPD